MCGLWGGISSTLVVGELNNISDLGVISQLRGRDSTGIAVFKHRKKKAIVYQMLKAVDHSSNFLYEREVVEAMYDSRDRPFLVLGHCRAATQGHVTIDNAHPFELGHIVGAHNGTIANIRGKTADGTDSEALLSILQREGLQEAVNAARSGAYALSWVDTRKQTLNFIRNGQRTLWTLTARGCFYWASECEMLDLVAARDNISASPVMLPVDTHLELDLQYPIVNQIKRSVSPSWPTVYYSKPEDKPAEKKAVVVTESKTCAHSCPLTDPLPWEKNKEKKEDKKPLLLASYQGFKGKTMDLYKAQRLLKEGCAFCAAECTYNDEKSAYWFNNKQYLCKECSLTTDARVSVNATQVYAGRITFATKGKTDHDCHGTA